MGGREEKQTHLFVHFVTLAHFLLHFLLFYSLHGRMKRSKALRSEQTLLVMFAIMKYSFLTAES